MYLEYLTHIYVLPLYSCIFGLIIVYLYDKFENKQYTRQEYVKFALLIYFSSLVTLYIEKNNLLKFNVSAFQSGGGCETNINTGYTQSIQSQNDLTKNMSSFKTGVPTF